MAGTTEVTRFMTFEGGEGVGKSTQATRIADRLRQAGHDVLVTREPGGTPFAEALRAVMLKPRDDVPAPLSQALVFYAARADHVTKVIAPALSRGAWVICDRFADSTRVYQGAAGGVPPVNLKALDALVLGEVRPSLTFIMDLPAEDGLRRAAARRVDDDKARQRDDIGADTGADMFEGREIAFHEALRSGFLALAANDPERCRVIDAAKQIEDIADDVWRITGEVFGV